MRIRRLFARTRPFRAAGFWLAAAVLVLAGSGGRSPEQLLVGIGFCCVWPLLAGRLHERWSPAGRADPGFYVAECALTALVLGWASVPASLAVAAAACLLAGATALAGWRLLVPALSALIAGATLGLGLAPTGPARSTPIADAAAAALLVCFTLALAQVAFAQTCRLEHRRLALATRSAALERLNGRMQQYLPPSLRDRLAAAPDTPCRWERCWLTVVFVDLVGFTELARRLDAEPLARLLDDYLGALIPTAEGRRGEVSKVMGDGVLVAFGLGGDLDRRSRAAAALAFCRDIPPVLERLTVRWRQRGEPVRLEVRAGIASGYCTLGDRGAPERLDFTLLGTPVNLASRLQAEAAPGAALVDAASAALVTPDVPLGVERRLVLKGLGEQSAHACALRDGASGCLVLPTAPPS